MTNTNHCKHIYVDARTHSFGHFVDAYSFVSVKPDAEGLLPVTSIVTDELNAARFFLIHIHILDCLSLPVVP